ncbi:MAG: hypothetical protein CL424_11735, partial [Acidimicrobiaceae bacterium]|nr:hypothetical protein [Acidimicrobiaceae bacterium]
WLEREACFVRRGTNNRKARVDPAEFGTRRMVAEGFVAAQFPHRTSRMGDPHLHWHVLVANTARGIDGRWTALDSLRWTGSSWRSRANTGYGSRTWSGLRKSKSITSCSPPCPIGER